MSFLFDIGIAIATMKVSRFIDSATELRQEQLTQAQLQNEITRLKMQLAEKELPYYTDEEWEAEFKRLESLT
jgi:hypothetical protein